MKKTYYPKHCENRMKNEGNVRDAREYFLTGQNRILYRLIETRFAWMNKYIQDNDENVIEIGTGAGLSRIFIENNKLKLTDIIENEWVDEYMDALNLTMQDDSMDVIICSETIHHIADPAGFLDNICRKLKKGGRLIIQDIYTGKLMKMVLRIMRHEGWSEEVNIFQRGGGYAMIHLIHGLQIARFLNCCSFLKKKDFKRNFQTLK